MLEKSRPRNRSRSPALRGIWAKPLFRQRRIEAIQRSSLDLPKSLRPTRHLVSRFQPNPPAIHVLAPNRLGSLRGLDTTIPHAVDYDLFCRFSTRFRFHPVPKIWSHYRLHDESKTVNKSHPSLVRECEEISRNYWGSWRSPLRWRCEISYRLHHRSRRPEAIASLRRAESALMARRYGEACLRWHRSLLERSSPDWAQVALSARWDAGMGIASPKISAQGRNP